MDENLTYTSELEEVLNHIEELVYKYPILSTTPDYLLVSILETDCKARLILEQMLTSKRIAKIYNAYTATLSERALKAIKPNRKILPNTALADILVKAEDEAKQLHSDKVTSAHFLLSLLRPDVDNELMKNVFESSNITYESVKKQIFKLQDKKEEEQPDEDTQIPENAQMIAAMMLQHITGPGKGKRGKPSINFIMPEDFEGDEAPREKKSALKEFCTNLNEEALNGKIDELVGRENELSLIINTLGRKKKNNCIIVGGDGVGKTELCRGLALKIVNGDVPTFLTHKKILSLNVTALVAGTQYRGLMESRISSLIKELKDNKDYILYVDDITSLFNEKKNSDVDISSSFSEALADGSIQVIGTCGFKGYRNVFDANQSLGRRFQKIVIEEPSISEATDILNSLKPSYELFHGIIYEDNIPGVCVKLAKKYLPERKLPDSAIDLFDEAGAQRSIEAANNEKTLALRKEIVDKFKEIKRRKEDDDYEGAHIVENDMNELKLELIDEQKKIAKKNMESLPRVDEGTIYNLIAKKTKIPVDKVSCDDKKSLININNILKESVIGQDNAIDVVCRAIKRNRVGLSSGKTMANLLFVGGTGLGKTWLAKQLAKEIFGDEKYLVRFDMSEYEDQTAVNKLIGSSAGYVGYENGGLLTETIKNKKYCVLLLDEFEKANPEVYNIFLQVFDEGYLSDNTGQKIDFKNTIVILTSNVGVRESNDFGKGIGFGDDDNTNTVLDKELKRKFSPEFLNRLDDIVYFNKLTEKNMKDIIKLELGKCDKRMKEIKYSISYEEPVIDFIYDKVKDAGNYGARPIIRIIQTEVENPITDLILENDYVGHEFHISCKNNALTIV